MRIVSISMSLALAGLLLAGLPASGQDPYPSTPPSPENTPLAPIDVKAVDRPNDAGGAILVRWAYSEKAPGPERFVIYRSEAGGPFERLKETRSVVLKEFEDEGVKDKVWYRYQVESGVGERTAKSAPSLPVRSSAQWFRWDRFQVLAWILVLGALVGYFIRGARKGREFYVRKIAGLSALDEAIGRATEMGKPVLFVPGLGLIDSVSTVAALNLLGEVARKTIEYKTPLICPNCDPVVYTVAREIVREAFVAAGQPEAFDPESVMFISEHQFAFAAAVDGIMVRDKPATNLFVGYYYAEALVLAETGAGTGAIQIAASDAISQLPFFITACDYTLLGEELYAASAYISREPMLLGTLKAQDYGKLVIMLILVVGSLLGLIFGFDVPSWFKTAE